MSVILYPPVDDTRILSDASNPVIVSNSEVESGIKRLITQQKITNKHLSLITGRNATKETVED